MFQVVFRIRIRRIRSFQAARIQIWIRDYSICTDTDPDLDVDPYHHINKQKNLGNLYSTVLWLYNDFLTSKTYVYESSESYKQKRIRIRHLVYGPIDPDPDLDLSENVTDP
jgi:hypothetical protein